MMIWPRVWLTCAVSVGMLFFVGCGDDDDTSTPTGPGATGTPATAAQLAGEWEDEDGSEWNINANGTGEWEWEVEEYVDFTWTLGSGGALTLVLDFMDGDLVTLPGTVTMDDGILTLTITCNGISGVGDQDFVGFVVDGMQAECSTDNSSPLTAR